MKRFLLDLITGLALAAIFWGVIISAAILSGAITR